MHSLASMDACHKWQRTHSLTHVDLFVGMVVCESSGSGCFDAMSSDETRKSWKRKRKEGSLHRICGGICRPPGKKQRGEIGGKGAEIDYWRIRSSGIDCLIG
mmetsp:Transcript_56103/g.109830  ORF Transcript_56103/g.109830 Transcript_56103/m.109830 type:complete len:102 (+) Transcript_56103:647-952(+)